MNYKLVSVISIILLAVSIIYLAGYASDLKEVNAELDVKIKEMDELKKSINDSNNECYDFGEEVGYSKGYDQGYSDGIMISGSKQFDGHLDAYNEGYNVGYDYGYDDGYEDGYQDGYDDCESEYEY